MFQKSEECKLRVKVEHLVERFEFKDEAFRSDEKIYTKLVNGKPIISFMCSTIPIAFSSSYLLVTNCNEIGAPANLLGSSIMYQPVL
jgi:hypothetical protein